MTDGAQAFVKKLVVIQPDVYYYPDQYNNEYNWKSHYHTTGPEIWNQTNNNVNILLQGFEPRELLWVHLDF